jgi:hypothetical protein
MSGAQRVVGLQASAAGAVGGVSSLKTMKIDVVALTNKEENDEKA